jgi:hypothetical protein
MYKKLTTGDCAEILSSNRDNGFSYSEERTTVIPFDGGIIINSDF